MQKKQEKKHDILPMTIGEKIKKLRKLNAWNKKNLADKANIDVDLIKKYEADKKAIPAEDAERLANAFNMSKDYFLNPEIKHSYRHFLYPGNKRLPFHRAVLSKQLRIVDDEGSEFINSTNDRGETALHISIIIGYAEAIPKLIEKKADVNLKVKEKEKYKKWSPLKLAIYFNNPKIVDLLLNAKAKFQIRGSKYKETEVEKAIAGYLTYYIKKQHLRNRKQIITSLVKAGANLDEIAPNFQQSSDYPQKQWASLYAEMQSVLDDHVIKPILSFFLLKIRAHLSAQLIPIPLIDIVCSYYASEQFTPEDRKIWLLLRNDLEPSLPAPAPKIGFFSKLSQKFASKNDDTRLEANSTSASSSTSSTTHSSTSSP